MQKEVITPTVLRKRREAERQKRKRSWYLIEIPKDTSGPKRRQLHVGGEAGHVTLSILADKEPAACKMQLTERDARSVRRSGFALSLTDPPPEDPRLSLREPGKSAKAAKAAAAKAEKAAKAAAAKADDDQKEGGR